MPTEYLEIFPQPGTQPCESFGMHPSLARIKELYEDGDASWFTNIGPMIEPLTVAERNAGTKRVPPSIGAHDVQQRHAQTVQPDNMNARGVLGRILKSLADPASDEKVSAAGFSLNGMQKALEGAGAAEVVDLTSNSGGFSGLIDYDKLKDDVKALVDKESSSIFAETYGSLLGPALANAEDVANILDSNDGLTENFPMTGLGNRFRDIARVIAQREAFGLNRAVFFVQIGGFDTHGTLMRLPSLLSEIDDAVGTFADEMKAQGIWEDVAVATMSDFGRTLTPNANPGTDHGWSGQHFVVGGGLEGSQIHGHYPTSFGPTGDRNYNQNRGVLIPTTPWDSMWAPLAKHMGVREVDMDFVIPNRANFPDILDHGDLFGEGPTPKPVQKPTAAPTIEPDAPCSVAGSRPFNGGTLHCIDIGEGQLVDVLTVTSGQRTCRHTDANSCPAGWDLWVPRSYAHAAAVRAAVDQRYLNVVGVYREESGCGACTGTPMNSDAQEEWEAAEEYRVAFKSVAGSPWFMRSTTFSEPNGNYVKDCWLTTSWGWDEGIGFRLDDGNCDYCFTDYLCSSNKYGHAPTPSPTQMPTPKTPYPTPKPTVSPAPSSAPTSVPTIGDVCGGETGTFTYDGKELRCIDMGGTIANVLLVEDGKETCHYQDENSCPPGMDIWVPQSYEHAKAVSDAVGGRPWTELTGIYRPADGAGEGNWHETLRDWAMNSESMEMYEREKQGNVGFTSVAPAGTPWFLRKDEWHRPSATYEAGCWMSTRWWDGVEENHGFRFYDNGCSLCFKRYMCSTNVINDWVFSHSPTAVPTPKPTTPKPTVAPVCGGRVGEFEYEGKTLVCLEVDGEIVNYLKVTHGARTCKATDANSCPAGFDIWVPRSYNHAVAVTERVEEPWLKSLVGIYRDLDGAGGGGAVAMTSEAQAQYELETGEIGWRSVAPLDEPWFLRKADPQRGQPSSRYNAKCWLNAWEYSYSGGVEPDWGFRFYANRCHNCFNHYLCSTNSVEAAPSMKPTVSLQPTTSMKPTAKAPSPTAADNARLCDASAWTQHNTHLAIDEADCAAKQTTSEQVSVLELSDETFTDLELSVDIRASRNWAGVLFRGSGITSVNDAGYQYWVGIHPTEGGGRIKIGRIENKWTQLDWKAVTVRADEFHRLVVRAIGCEIDVELDGEPIFKRYDCTFDSGSIALRTYYGHAEFKNLRIHEAFAPTPAPSTAAPTISFSGVCEKPGTATYGDKTVHCLEVDGMLLDVLKVENGKQTCRQTDETSCPAGMNIWVPRSYEHAKAVRETFGEASSRLVGIYRDGGSHPLAGRKCGGCTDVAMNSDAQEAYEAEEPINAGFKSVAGAPWFLRSTPLSEPNGDYELGCWLRTWGWQNGQGFYLNDHNCNYCYQTYLCSTNQMADAPTTSPTKVPTLKPTATPDWEVVGVTGSVIVSGLSTKEIEDPAVKIVFEEAITAVAELADAEGTTITVSFDERRRLGGPAAHTVQSGEVVANYVIKAPAAAALHLVKLLEGIVATEPEVVTHALEHAADEVGGSVVDTFASGKVHTSYVDSPVVDPPIATGAPTLQPTGPTAAPTNDLCATFAPGTTYSQTCFRVDVSSGAVAPMGPMKGAWNSKDKCAEQGLEIKWGTHWCPAVDMECVPDVFGCLRHDRKTGALKTVASGAWATQDFCESKNAAPRWTTKWCPAPAGDGAEFPACGVRITRGRGQDPNKFQCVTDPKKMEHAGKKIAFACCEADTCTRMDEDGQCYAGNRAVAPKDWYEATNVCAAEGKVLCGVDKPCSRGGCGYDGQYQWTGEECQADDVGVPAACA